MHAFGLTQVTFILHSLIRSTLSNLPCVSHCARRKQQKVIHSDKRSQQWSVQSATEAERRVSSQLCFGR